MCNINLVLNKGKALSLLPSMYMNVASMTSWKGNNHGEGMIGFRNKHINVYKSINKLIYRQMYWFLATHQRYATSGKRDAATSHPYESSHFYLMHNGIFSGLGDREKSDTMVYLEMLEEAYVANNLNLMKSLNDVHSKVGGFYSIVLYVKGTGKVYYYKNNSASMYGIQNKEWLILSTSEDNINYARRFFKIGGKMVFEENIVYDLRDSMRVVGKITTKAREPEPEPEYEPKPKDDFQKKVYNYYGNRWF